MSMPKVDAGSYPYGVDVITHTQVIPKLPPPEDHEFRWRIGPVTDKTILENTPQRSLTFQVEGDLFMQLLATQQVGLSITGTDKYGNAVDISGDVQWVSSDTSIITVENIAADNASCMAVTTGTVGTAAVTVTNDVDQDGTGDFIGSIAFDVVAGPMAEIEVTAGEATDKPS